MLSKSQIKKLRAIALNTPWHRFIAEYLIVATAKRPTSDGYAVRKTADSGYEIIWHGHTLRQAKDASTLYAEAQRCGLSKIARDGDDLRELAHAIAAQATH